MSSNVHSAAGKKRLDELASPASDERQADRREHGEPSLRRVRPARMGERYGAARAGGLFHISDGRIHRHTVGGQLFRGHQPRLRQEVGKRNRVRI